VPTEERVIARKGGSYSLLFQDQARSAIASGRVRASHYAESEIEYYCRMTAKPGGEKNLWPYITAILAGLTTCVAIAPCDRQAHPGFSVDS
jgi:hypothetical protein